MTHITIIALGSTGDVLPYTALGKGLADAGCQVRFATFQVFASRVSDLGLDFLPIPGDPRRLVAQGGSDIYSMAKSFATLARDYMKALSQPKLLETDLIVNQLPGGLFGRDLAERAGIPMVLAAVIPLLPTKQFPMMGFPSLPLPGFNLLTYDLAERAAWGLFKKEINRWRKDVLGLPTRNRKKYFSGDHLVVNGFSPVVVERPPEWGEQAHITGYWFPEDPSWQPPPSLEEFLADGPAPVFIGFGSMPVKDPRRTTEIILEALRQTGQRGVLQRGWGGIGDLDPGQDIYPLDYAPFGWLFPKMALVVHHGGSGTTGFGLRAGVPSCAVALGFDQIFWGKRIADLGAGPEPLLQRKLSVESLVAIIQQGIENEAMRKRAGEIGRAIRAEQGISAAVDLVTGAVK